DGTETKAAALRASPVSAAAGVAASLPGKTGQGCGGEPSADSRGEMKRPALDSRAECACALRGGWPCGSSPLPAAARSYGVSSGEAGGGRLALGPAIAALPKQTEV